MSHQFTEHVAVKQNKSRKVWRPRGLSGELQLADCMAHESTKKCQALFQALASIFGGYGTFSISPPQIPVKIMKKPQPFFFQFSDFLLLYIVFKPQPTRQSASIWPLDFVDGYTRKLGSITSVSSNPLSLP